MAQLFRKILKGVLIGGGTILSLLCPPVGGAIITAGMQIGAGAAAAGSLIQTDSPATIDTTTSQITKTLTQLGLMQPAGYVTKTGVAGAFIIQPWMWMVAGFAAVALIFKSFKRRRR